MNNECILILDNIRSVENTGSIFRTAEGLGVEKIILVGTTPAPIDRFGRRRGDFAKVALGAEELVSYEVCKSISSKLGELKEEGYKVIALEQHSNSVKLSVVGRELLVDERLVLIVGNEVEGVSQEALDLTDMVVEIPMRGKKESLNVSVATGIALFQMLSQ